MTGPLQALARRYDRLAATGEIQAYGYSMEQISYAIVLSRDGRLVDVSPLLDTSGKKPRPSPRLVPQSFKRPGTTPRSFFLWDKSPFVLGVTRDERNKRAIALAPRQHAAFKALHRELLAGTQDEGLRALLAFLDAWTPERFEAPPFSPDMLDANIVFRLDGDREWLHDRPAARALWAAKLSSADAPRAVCLVSGTEAPVARLHPAIKGVAGAQSAGASIVSFNQDAFTSYGKEQGANAPVSEAAAFAYTAALNALLARDSGNHARIGDATVVFWAEAPEAEAIVRGFFDAPATDATEAAAVRDVLERMAEGRPIEEAAPDVDESTSFYLLGLSPNAARLSLRFWLDTSFGELARRFQEHWRDLRIEPSPWNARLPALWRLLHELAPQGKAENVPAHLAGELTRAILTGRRYPRSVLAAVIMRMRADRQVNGRRAAICKACLVRALRLNDPSLAEDHLVSLDPDNTNPGYRLGRLFAELESVQLAALRGVKATIRDRYYGAASATPASIFPVLLRSAPHHLAVLRKRDGAGLAHWFEREMAGIIDGLEPSLPRSLSIEDQGRFAIGYYHQRRRLRREAPEEARAALAEADAAVDRDTPAED